MADSGGLRATLPEAAGEPGAATGQLGRYPITGHLGAGGMGEVLQVRDPELDRPLAAKVARASDPAAVQRFVREARITGQLEHPGIVPVHELGRTPDGCVYFTMKQVAGQTLRAGPVGDMNGLLARLRQFLRVCEALRFAHGRGVIHRDLKPDNVMIGEFGEVQVLDWGLARALDASEPEDPLAPALTPDLQGDRGSPLRTVEGEVMGTPAYMPPEQARGDAASIDRRSDLFALGAILYELLTDRPPYEGETRWAVLFAAARGRVVPPRERAPERAIPWELEAIVLRAMAPRPGDRYPDVAALQTDLECYLAGVPLRVAARYSIRQRLVKWARRNRRAVTAGGLVAAAAAAMLAGVAWQARAGRLRKIASARRLLARSRAQAAAPLAAWAARRVDRLQPPVRRERLALRTAREAALRDALAARAVLDEVLRRAAGDGAARRLRRDCGQWLGRLALASQDYTLAEHAIRELGRLGLDAAAVDGQVARVRDQQRALQRARHARLTAIVEDLRAGRERPGRPADAPTRGDYVIEAVGYRDRQTVDLLGGALAGLVDRVRTTSGRVAWTPADVDVATFCCQVLGRLRLEEAVTPLSAWLAATDDLGLATEAALALCNTARPEAHWPLSRAARRWGRTLWRRIEARFALVPEDRAGREAPSTAADWVLEGGLRQDRGELAAALQAYDRAIARAPDDAVAHACRGIARLQAGDLRRALADLDRCLALDPHLVLGYANRGAARHALGDTSGARADLDEALARDPDLVDALVNRARVRLEAGELEGALADAGRALAAAPEDAGAVHLRGSIFHAQGQLDAARADYDRAIRLDPRAAASYVNRGNLHVEQGRPDAALADYRRAIALDPRQADAYLNRAGIRAQRRDLAGALVDLDQAVELDPRSKEARFNRSLIRRMRGDAEGADADLEAALALDPDFAQALLVRGMRRARAGQLQAAGVDLDRHLRRQPDSVIGWFWRGQVHVRLGQQARAVAAFSEVIRRRPREAQPYTERATAYWRLGQLDKALADARSAAGLAPRSWRTQTQLAMLLADGGRKAEAVAVLRRALEAVPPADRGRVERALRHLQGDDR